MALPKGTPKPQGLPGLVQINKILIESCFGEMFDISSGSPSIIQDIKIYEGIFKPTLSGRMIVNDGQALTEIVPLRGAERIHIEFQAPKSDIKVSLSFRIVDINKRTPSKDSMSSMTYTIEFISEERMMSAYSRISTPYSGSVDEIIKKIYNDHIKTGKRIDEDDYFSETLGIIKYIPPSIYPLDAIKRLCAYAGSDIHKSGLYVFYETLYGFRFECIHDMFGQRPVNVKPYTYDIKNLAKQSTEQEMLMIEGLEIQSSFPNQYNALREGMYASSLYTHDIYNKSISSSTYDYIKEFDEVTHTPDGFPLIDIGGTGHDSSMKTNLTKIEYMNLASRSNIHTIPTHNKQYKEVLESDQVIDFDSAASTANDFVLHRNSEKRQLESFRIAIRVPGVTNLTAGNTVKLNLHSFRKEQPKNPILSGTYLIAECIHNFNHDFYKTELTLVKDAPNVAFMSIGSSDYQEDV